MPRSQQHGPQQTKGCGKTQTAVAGCLCSLEGQVPTVERLSLHKEETWLSPEDTTPSDTGRSPEEKPCVIPLWGSPEESDPQRREADGATGLGGCPRPPQADGGSIRAEERKS